MRLIALLLMAACASCGSSLGDPNQPDPPTTTTLPEWTDADCMMFNPTACRLDVAKRSVGIDVHYPNTYFCRLQLVPTADLLKPEAFNALAAAWQVTIGFGANDQAIITPDQRPEVAGHLEYPLGTGQLYVTRVTFMSKSSASLASLVADAFGRPDVSLFAIPVECPGRRPAP